MAENSSISWTDHTHNPWIGCTRVSPGCDACYAETLDYRWGGDHWGKGKPRKVLSDANWAKPLKWNRDAEKAGTIAKVFCGSMCDVMDDEAPDGQRERLWALIDATPHLFWQLLTKRPHRYERYLPAKGFAHNNVILMATIEMQEFYASRIKALHCGAQLLESRNDIERRGAKPVMIGVSYEPALGPLSIREYHGMRPHWLIYGGETGPRPRPMEISWAENIRAECEEFGVKFWMKQMSARTPEQAADLIPVSMLIREFPATMGK